GNLTFMTEQNSYLVRHRLALTTDDCRPYPAGVEWAEPDIDHAAELMRRVYDRPDEAREVGQRARRDIQQHSLGRTAAFVRKRIDDIPQVARLLAELRGPLDRAAELAG